MDKALSLKGRSEFPKVYLVTKKFYPYMGGAERQAERLARALIHRGLSVRVVTAQSHWRLPHDEVIDEVPVHRSFALWERIGRPIRVHRYVFMFSLYGYLVRHRHEFDVIQANEALHHAFIAVVAGKRLGKKVIIRPASSGTTSDFRAMHENRVCAFGSYMVRRMRECDHTVAISAGVEKDLIREGFDPEGIIRIPNGVDIRVNIKPSYQLGSQPLVLYVGRLSSEKGPDVLIEAFQRVVRGFPTARLRIVGGGLMRGELIGLAESLSISDSVEFTGVLREGLSPQYLAADVQVIPSRMEGMSNVLLEAMAHGLPCVVTDVGGNPEVITHNRDGWLVPPEQPQALVEAICELLADRNLAKRLGQNARETVAQRHSLNRMVDSYLDLYCRAARLSAA